MAADGTSGHGFFRIVGNFYSITPEQQTAIRQVRLNVTDYDKRLEHWFSQDELGMLYARCPHWAELEERVYGQLLKF